MKTCKVRLTQAQVSALQCRDLGELEDRVLAEAWDGDYLRWEEGNTIALMDVLIDHANGEDAEAEFCGDKVMAGYARRAARSLTCVVDKVLKAGGAL